MAKKSKPKKPAKAKSGGSLASKVLGKAKSTLGIGASKGTGTGRHRRKKSALFYAREIQRLKLKKKYDKIKIGV